MRVPVSQIARMRNRRKTKSKRNPLFGLGVIFCLLISLIIAGMGVGTALRYTDLTQNLPSVEILPGLIEPPSGLFSQPTQLYDRTGQNVLLVIQNPHAGDRKYLFSRASSSANMPASVDFLPSNLITTTLVSGGMVEPADSGFSFARLIRRGGPNIPERLAVDLLLRNKSGGFSRDIKAQILGSQISERFSREKVIEWYLNTTSFGNSIYGAQAAAMYYFGKSAHDLTFSEAAFLTALAESPELDRETSFNSAQIRQKSLIEEALRLRMLSPNEAIEASRAQTTPYTTPEVNERIQFSDLAPGVDPAFARLALDQLQTQFTQEELERGGLQVLTTLDFDLQKQVDCVRKYHEQRLKLVPGVNPGGIPIDCPAARLLPALSSETDFSSAYLISDAAVIDPASGQILAISTGDQLEDNGGYLAPHPAGSLANLFVYLTGFTRGFSPGSLVWDLPEETNHTQDQNFDGQFHGPQRLRMAFANDYMGPAQNVLNQVGMENVMRTIQQLGILNPNPDGSDSHSTMNLLRPLDILEISQALSALANQGISAGRLLESNSIFTKNAASENETTTPLRPSAILKVDDLTGHNRLDWQKPQTRPILTSQLTFLITHMMSDETARWPSLGYPNPLEIGRPAAAKISSTPTGDSTWVLGYTPQRMVGVWLGSEQGLPVSDLDHIKQLRLSAAGLWHAIMQYANQGLTYQDFEMPPGVTTIQVCDPSGLLPTVACPNVVDEVYMDGNGPVQLDTLYKISAINKDTGQLATIYTPPDLVEQRAYFSIPPEAEAWAHQAGMEAPPTEYDVFPAQINNWPDTRIDSPRMFDGINDGVAVLGRAAGAGFAFYRVQYGKGPNPQKWLPIGEDSTKPVLDGKLADWDTRGLDGLYALQLVVVRDDQSAERSTILVTADNQPPMIVINRPKDNETITSSERKRIVLQAAIEDNLAIDSVTFQIDGEFYATFIQPPYAISWHVEKGTHSFEVIATDKAGNKSQAQVDFLVQ